jgi:uncharacterized surface protein with fasciclin (FAS1) repeats
MIANRLLTAAACAALAAGASGLAWGQTPQSAQTQAEAQAATGKPTTDAPANTQRQGAAAAVAQGTGAAPPTAPAAPPAASVHIAPAGDIIQTLQAGGQFTTLIKALNATNLTPVLKNNKNLTVFAPTDAAFAAYMPTDKLLADLPGLQKLLTHHVINAEVDTAKFKNAHGPVQSVAGDKIVLDGTGEPFKADQANILQADVRASNGLIDVVDQVLKAGSVPETLPQAAEPAPAAEPAAPAKPAAASAKKKGTKRGR